MRHSPALESGKDRPSFLILFPDQFRHDAIASFGIGSLRTPHLDRLTRESTRFCNAYSPNPICVPARHCLLTSRLSGAHGYCDNAPRAIADSGLPTFPRILSENGYRTAAIGKCHFHPVREHHGYHELQLMEELPAHPGDDEYLRFLQESGYECLRSVHGVRPIVYHEPQEALMPGSLHGTNWVADRAVEWLRRNGERDFLLTCGFIAPHPPFNIPAENRGSCDPSQLPYPQPRMRPTPFSNETSDWYGDGDSEEHRREIRAAYHDSVSMVDAAIGRILTELETLGLLESTCVIFLSDHGEMLQDKGFYQKALPFESSAKIPLLVRYPSAFAPGAVDARLVDLLDIFPTLLDLAGINHSSTPAQKESPLLGKSLVPAAAAESPWRDMLFFECLRGARRWIGARDSRYKYARFYNGGFEWLFDLQNDPLETRELISFGKAPEKVLARFRKFCTSSESAHGQTELVDGGSLKTFPHDPAIHAPDDWDSGAKFPRWLFVPNSFPAFGKLPASQEADIFLAELRACLAHRGQPTKELLKCPAPAAEILAKTFASLGGNPDSLFIRK